MKTQDQTLTPEAYWRSYQSSLPGNHPHTALAVPLAWGFGSTPAMADELGDLVLRGLKTATCGLLWENEAGGEDIPKPGDLSIILDGRGSPLCLIETVEVEVKPFQRVDARFAHDEGEGDRSLDYWRAVHWHYFSPICTALGKAPHPSMPLVCERFRLVWAGAAESVSTRKLEKEQDMAEMKTRPNQQSVEAFLNSVPDETKRRDSFTLLEMMQQAAHAKPVMWGDSIVGFGSYHYRYQSGREGDMPIIGFSPRCPGPDPLHHDRL